MSSACKRFFSIPELAIMMESDLSKHDITMLIRTCRYLSIVFTPSLYKDLSFHHNKQIIKHFQFVEYRGSIEKNLRYVQSFSASAYFTHLFYDLFSGPKPFIFNINEIPLELNPQNVLHGPPSPYPTFLTSALISLTCKSDEMAAIHILPVLSIIRGNPDLSHIHLEDVHIHTRQDFIHLICEISRLQFLRTLFISLEDTHSAWCAFGESLYYSCPPSIERLKIVFKGQGKIYSDYNDFGDIMESKYQIANRYFDEEAILYPVRNPMIKLQSLCLQGNNIHFPIDKIMSLIAHCPNLRELGLGSLEGDISDITMVQLGQFIGTRCPRLEIFDHSPGFLNQHYGTLVLVIMETLSAHSLKELYLKMFNDTVEQLAPMIAKHSQTLRKIHLLDYISLKSSNIQSILCCCSTLKEFKLVRYNTSSGCLLDVDGAKGQWACINLTYLEMPVEINDDNQDFYQRISNYVYRPTPLVLNTIEKEHFESLRRFYSQFGRLVDLEYLRLERAYPGIPNFIGGTHYVRTEYNSGWFPAMLSLGRPDKNWPGYLRELSRLSRLKELRGSVGALSYEAIETVSIEEARHICQCWPQLRVAEFKCGQRSAQESEFLVELRRCNPKLTII